MSTEYRIAKPRAARYDKQMRQAFGFPWLYHYTLADRERLERRFRAAGVTLAELLRLRGLRERETRR